MPPWPFVLYHDNSNRMARKWRKPAISAGGTGRVRVADAGLYQLAETMTLRPNSPVMAGADPPSTTSLLATAESHGWRPRTRHDGERPAIQSPHFDRLDAAGANSRIGVKQFIGRQLLATPHAACDVVATTDKPRASWQPPLQAPPVAAC